MVNNSRIGELIARHAPVTSEWRARLDGSARVAVLAKSRIAAMQRAAPPYGGMASDGFRPTASFLSPGGAIEPMLPRAVERLAGLLAGVGFEGGDVVLNGFGYHFTPAGLLFHEALVQLGCQVLPVGPQNIELQAEFARRMRATAFVGIASHLKILLEQAGDLEIRVAMAGAEPHGGAVRTQLRERWGVRCADLYGFAEAGIVAASCAPGDTLHFHPDLIAEVVEPTSGEPLADGEAGELVASIDNPGFPLLRLGTGDLVRIDTQACLCGRGRGFHVLGRVGASVRVKGMLLHQDQLRGVLKATGALACRIEVTRAQDRDAIALYVKASNGALQAEALNEAFRSHCRLGADRIVADATLADGDCLVADLRGPSA